MSSNPARFDRVAIFLHWCIGLGIIAIAAVEILRGELPKGNAIREALKLVHNPAGTVIFVLVLVRITWRLSHPAPAAPAGTSAWERHASTASHLALYAMMIAIPLLGIVFTFARGRPIDFGLFQIVYPLDQVIGTATMKVLKKMHEFLGQAVLGLAFVHAAAALWHHYVRRDDVLTRMLPRSGSAVRPIAALAPKLTDADDKAIAEKLRSY